MEAGTFELSVTTSIEIGEARRAVEGWLRSRECRNVADVALVFCELVTNAVRHAGGARRVVTTHHDDVVRLAVDDHSAAPPAMRAQPGPTGGFGLRLVEQLTMSWGWTRTPRGKQVWAEMRFDD
jgi:anti-sigma regulatory factor (Ser/Thr protein kinase)